MTRLLGALCIAALATSAQAQTGDSLLKSCTQALQFIETNAQTGELYEVGQCIGYINGVAHGIDAALLSTSKSFEDYKARRFYCGPEQGVSSSQLVRVVHKYLSDNPEYLHQQGNVLVAGALIKAFPCSN